MNVQDSRDSNSNIYGCGAHFCRFHITRLVSFDSDASPDVIDSESADGVTMCSNQQPDVCTHLTFILPIALRSTFFQQPSQQPWSCDAIKKMGRVMEIHSFTRSPHTTITHLAGEHGHPRFVGQEVYTKQVTR
jgi:hypothetical protein